MGPSLEHVWDGVDGGEPSSMRARRVMVCAFLRTALGRLLGGSSRPDLWTESGLHAHPSSSGEFTEAL